MSTLSYRRPGLKWRPRFMEMARIVASWSDYPGGGNGAVLVSPDCTLSINGYTGLPDGDDRPYDQVQDDEVLHAEVNALHNAKLDVTGWVLYCTKAPCRNCASHIIRRKIARVICAPQGPESRWFCNTNQARERLEAARIDYVSYTGAEV